MQKRVVICGAAGRDFHNFNVVYRDDRDAVVVAFTATQIPGIDGRRYPSSVAGSRYPDGIPILPEQQLERLIRDQRVDEIVFAYSDIDYDQLMHVGSRALASGADFKMLGPKTTMLSARIPVIAVSAVRTGCGKSQTARYLSSHLSACGYDVAVLRHPMPYGNLERQAVQRFVTLSDLDNADCTLEEREEYEPHVAAGGSVYAGIDYSKILGAAEGSANVIVWDGGNNDFPFVRPDLHIVLVDALRPDQLTTHYPGEAVLRSADVVVVSKANSASSSQLEQIHAGLCALVPDRPVITAASILSVSDTEVLEGARVLIVEDAPSITHGGMSHGAGYQAVHNMEGLTIIDPRPFAVGEIRSTFDQYPHIGPVLPAMGYTSSQQAALTETIEAAHPDVVVTGTPIDLGRVLDISVPVVRVRYEYSDDGDPGLLHYAGKLLSGD